MKIFVIAGEASGDQLGAAVLSALKRIDPDVAIRGIGGAAMLSAGLRDPLFPMEELSLMGIFEVVPEIPHMLKRIRQTVDAIRAYNPDIVLTIDSPDFCFRVQKDLSKTSCRAKRIHMVAPTVWAWRPKRAEKISKFIDGIMCLYPFEPPYFEREGLKSVFIGHTMMNSGVLDGNGAAFRFRHMIGNDRKVLGLFFGSRKSEIERCSDLLLDAACELRKENPDLFIIAPTLPRWKDLLEAKFRERWLNGMVITGNEEKWDAVAACDAALAVSGTVALEIAVAGIPHVITYRMNKLTWNVMRSFVKTKYAHLANILLDREAVPEFVQDKATLENIVPALSQILNHGALQQVEDFKTVRAMLKPDDKKNPADLAAGFLVSFISP